MMMPASQRWPMRGRSGPDRVMPESWPPSRGLVVRDARRCRAPHHEGRTRDLILRAALARGVSKDEAIVLMHRRVHDFLFGCFQRGEFLDHLALSRYQNAIGQRHDLGQIG